MNTIKIGPKLVAGFLVIAMIAATIGVIGIMNIRSIDERDTQLYERMTVPITYLVAITESFQRIRVNTRDYLLAQDDAERQKATQTIQTLRQEIDDYASLYEKRIVSESHRAAFARFQESRLNYRAELDRFLAFAAEGKLAEAQEVLDTTGYQAAMEEQKQIEELVKLKQANAKSYADENTQTANGASFLMILSVIFGTLIAIWLGLALTFSITRPLSLIAAGMDFVSLGDIQLKKIDQQKLGQAQRRGDEIGTIAQSMQRLVAYIAEKESVAKLIAAGDLTVTTTIASDEDDFGKSFRQMRESLSETLAQVRDSIEMVASGSSQVASASQDLSQGATEQASSLEEISSSMTEVAGQSVNNTKIAQEANSLAQKTAKAAVEGNEAVVDLGQAMEKINTSAAEIKKIVKVIDDIAFQVNLLALNANVEAARAGKYGKGFAVVAEEVRNLANRSGAAVKETTTMVDDALTNIAKGNENATATAKKLEEIQTLAGNVAGILEEIAAASREQTKGIEQVSTALGQIDQVTQSNTASAEESASAAEELSGQAEHLKAMIARFRLDQKEASRPVVRAPERKVPPTFQKKVAPPPVRAASPRPSAPQVIKLTDEDFDTF